LHFNQLPKEDIIHFLSNISEAEQINLSKQSLHQIQQLYGSDIRSMINFIQSNQDIDDKFICIINELVWNDLYNKIKKNSIDLLEFVNLVGCKYNMDKKNIIKHFLNYIIRNHCEHITTKFMDFTEFIIHMEDCNVNYYTNYALIKLKILLQT
jgi:replication factor C subunit 3/5